MKNLIAILSLVIVVVMFSPGYADTDSYKEFIRAVQAQKQKSGRPEVTVESATCIIIIFGLKNGIKHMKFDKLKDAYKIKEIQTIKKVDPPVEVLDTPEERAQEAMVTYELGQRSKRSL